MPTEGAARAPTEPSVGGVGRRALPVDTAAVIPVRRLSTQEATDATMDSDDTVTLHALPSPVVLPGCAPVPDDPFAASTGGDGRWSA
ncbi:hypothetical protein HALDL1_12610 [Halobacterium sp. DL1]|nr:hypothetical protein HALDL1_12610 [Halobacterium sp. DL1]